MWTCGCVSPLVTTWDTLQWWRPAIYRVWLLHKKVLPAHDIPGSDLMRTDNMVFRANWHWGAEPLHSTSHANKSLNCILLFSEICCGETNTGQLSSNLPFSGDDFILKDCHQVAELRMAARGQQSCKHTISWSKTTKNPLSQDISAHWGKCRDRSCN